MTLVPGTSIGNPLATLAAVTVLDRDVTSQEVVNTAVETTVYTFSVPANTLSTNRTLRLHMSGSQLNNSGVTRTLTIRIKYGATTLYDSSGMSLSTNGFRRAIEATLNLTAANATGAQRSDCILNISGTDAVAGAGKLVVGDFQANHITVAEDSTTALTLEITAQHQVADANISFIIENAMLELL